MQTVWRVMNHEGQGPYVSMRSTYTIWTDDNDGHFSGRHPCPYEDGIPTGWGKDLGICCGFESEKQMREWFTPTELDRLANLGYHPVQVEATQVWKGNRQLVFVPKGSLAGIVPMPPSQGTLEVVSVDMEERTITVKSA